jgi:hypothetical protein
MMLASLMLIGVGVALRRSRRITRI